MKEVLHELRNEKGTVGALRMITAMNFTDFLYRPRRPEELDTARARAQELTGLKIDGLGRGQALPAGIFVQLRQIVARGRWAADRPRLVRRRRRP